MSISYAVEKSVSLADFMHVLKESGLAERRPIDDAQCLQGMLDNSNLMITARTDGELIGIARSVTDFHYCCYLSDLAVSAKYQNMGVGLRLQQETQDQLGPKCKLILISAPVAMAYYPKIGYQPNGRCFTLDRDKDISK